MPIGEDLLKKINKVLNVNNSGDAIRKFLSKAGENGKIKGDRFSRTLVYDKEGKRIKDHWERKGKVS